MKKEQGFSAVETLISTAITLVVLAWALSSFNDSLGANEQATQIADLEQNLRAGVNLLVSDLITAGWSIPIGGIPIPSGAGVDPVVRPGPSTGTLNFNTLTISAVNPGPLLGPTWNGHHTDIVNILYADNTEFAHPLNDHPLVSLTANGSVATVSEQTPIDEMDHPIRIGDLISLSNARGSTLQYVTDVSEQSITFGIDDPMNLNQPNAPAGSITQIGNGDGTFPATTATRVYLVTYYLDFTEDPETPRLIRRINNDPGRTVALILENLQLSYDLVDGVNNPTAVKEAVDPYSPSQIRKANILISGRSSAENRHNGEYLRKSLTTQVSLRSLSYIDRYSQ